MVERNGGGEKGGREKETDRQSGVEVVTRCLMVELGGEEEEIGWWEEVDEGKEKGGDTAREGWMQQPVVLNWMKILNMGKKKESYMKSDKVGIRRNVIGREDGRKWLEMHYLNYLREKEGK